MLRGNLHSVSSFDLNETIAYFDSKISVIPLKSQLSNSTSDHDRLIEITCQICTCEMLIMKVSK